MSRILSAAGATADDVSLRLLSFWSELPFFWSELVSFSGASLRAEVASATAGAGPLGGTHLSFRVGTLVSHNHQQQQQQLTLGHPGCKVSRGKLSGLDSRATSKTPFLAYKKICCVRRSYTPCIPSEYRCTSLIRNGSDMIEAFLRGKRS